MNTLTILKPGCFVDMHGTRKCFTASDIAGIANRYRPVTGKAPLVIGHPKDDGTSPAYGWVKSLSVDLSGSLLAVLDRVSEEFKSLVHDGKYRHLSASLYPPGHPTSPDPSGWYLRHLGALGASLPAIPGLSLLAFSEPMEISSCCGRVDFSAPSGWTPDPYRLSIHSSAIAMSDRFGIDYIAAVKMIEDASS